MPILVFFIIGLAIMMLKKALIWVALAFVFAVIGSFSERLEGLCAVIAIFSFFIVIGYDSNYGPEKFMAVASFILILLALLFFINQSMISSESTTNKRKEISVLDAFNDALVNLFHSKNYKGEKPNYKAFILGTMFALFMAFMFFMITVIG